jgi:hypothetical protein
MNNVLRNYKQVSAPTEARGANQVPVAGLPCDVHQGELEMTRFAGRATVAAVVLFGTITVPKVASAEGAGYDVWSCKAPDGEPAVTRDEAGGWAASSYKTNASGGNFLVDSCGAGGTWALSIADRLPQPTGSELFLRFTAPAGTTIRRYELDFDGYTRPLTAETEHGDLMFGTSQQADPDYDARFQGSGVVSRRTIAGSGRGGDYFQIGTSCSIAPGRQGTCSPGSDGSVARMNLYRSTLTLEDRDAPSVSSVSGDAVTGDLWAGSTGIAVGATDHGGGVYRLGVEVDGEVKSWLNLAGAPCRPWPGTERTFLAPKPCPSTVGGVQTISTSDLPEGSHTVRVLVEDAAGNQTTAYGPVTKTLSRSPVASADPGPLNGSPASAEAVIKASWEGRESPTRSVRYDQQPVLRGQLTTAAGQPIKDAAVRVTITRSSRNSPAFERESLQTNSEGRFRWKMPKGSSSRKITLSYRQRVRDPKPVVSKSLQLNVSAGVRLSLSRTTARKGQSVRLTGLLRGRPVPGGGKVVELQARNPGGKWITFRNVRAKKSGKFSATYRFRNPGPARFQMRARARKSGDYPYTTGSSPVRSIRIR